MVRITLASDSRGLWSWAWWRMPLVPTLGKQKQVDLCELEASLVYKSKFQDRQSYTENPCLKKPTK